MQTKTYQNLWDVAKAVLGGMFLTINPYINEKQKQKRSQISNLT